MPCPPSRQTLVTSVVASRRRARRDRPRHAWCRPGPRPAASRRAWGLPRPPPAARTAAPGALDAAVPIELDALLAADTTAARPVGAADPRRAPPARSLGALVHATVVVDLKDGGLTTIQLDHGTISAVSGTSLTIAEAGGGSVTVALGGETRIRRDGAKAAVGGPEDGRRGVRDEQGRAGGTDRLPRGGPAPLTERSAGPLEPGRDPVDRQLDEPEEPGALRIVRRGRARSRPSRVTCISESESTYGSRNPIRRRSSGSRSRRRSRPVDRPSHATVRPYSASIAAQGPDAGRRRARRTGERRRDRRGRGRARRCRGGWRGTASAGRAGRGPRSPPRRGRRRRPRARNRARTSRAARSGPATRRRPRGSPADRRSNRARAAGPGAGGGRTARPATGRGPGAEPERGDLVDPGQRKG